MSPLVPTVPSVLTRNARTLLAIASITWFGVLCFSASLTPNAIVLSDEAGYLLPILYGSNADNYQQLVHCASVSVLSLFLDLFVLAVGQSSRKRQDTKRGLRRGDGSTRIRGGTALPRHPGCRCICRSRDALADQFVRALRDA